MSKVRNFKKKTKYYFTYITLMRRRGTFPSTLETRNGKARSVDCACACACHPSVTQMTNEGLYCNYCIDEPRVL